MEDEICGSCTGSGEGQYEGTKCSTCKGSGVEPVYTDEDDYIEDDSWDDDGWDDDF